MHHVQSLNIIICANETHNNCFVIIASLKLIHYVSEFLEYYTHLARNLAMSGIHMFFWHTYVFQESAVILLHVHLNHDAIFVSDCMCGS